MIIIKGLEINNYKAIEKAKLTGMLDLNLFIGPNNCGKTSILDALELIGKFQPGGNIQCRQCRDHADSADIAGFACGLDSTEPYLREKEVEISFCFDEEGIKKIIPGALEEVRKRLPRNCQQPGSMDEIRVKGKNHLEPVHISPFCDHSILEKMKNEIVYCPDRRLDTYKKQDQREYIESKNFRGSKLQEWVNYMREIIDKSIEDHTQRIDLVRKLDGKDFETTIEEQGSGVRSLACVWADLKGADRSRIVLIDEPELGLNPINKQDLLKFLLKESLKKQVFLATHDPTFVNPVIWEKQNVAVFTYSAFKGEFVKLNINESKEDPGVFGGYLPHTTSLEDIHIYVEGSSDVYILQVFLRKALKERFEDWAKKLNRVGVFHLGGDFWPHLLHTVPKSPYRCIVILDGDKRDEAKEVCEKYISADIKVPNFEFVEQVSDLRGMMEKEGIPVYCLKRKCIEEYLEPKPLYKNAKYRKNVEGPIKAENMEQIPDEIKSIFESIL